MNVLLITGTDTEVGKTVLTVALAAYWQKYQLSRTFGIMKLIQAGIGDRQLYTQTFSCRVPENASQPCRAWVPFHRYVKI